MKNYIYLLVLLSTFTLSGCGGATGESTTTDGVVTSSSASTSELTSTSTPLMDTIANTLNEPDISGVIVDASGVTGLKLICGQDETLSGVNGEFFCEEFPMSIYLGEYKLGEVQTLPLDKIIYTQDILNIPRGATTRPSVTKISMILQSLDNDSNLENGIDISEESVALLESHIYADTNLDEVTIDDVTYFLEDTIRRAKDLNANSRLTLVDNISAQINLTTMTAQTPTLTYEQRSSGRI